MPSWHLLRLSPDFFFGRRRLRDMLALPVPFAGLVDRTVQTSGRLNVQHPKDRMPATHRPCAVFVLGLAPVKIGGIEKFLRLFAQRMDASGWDTVLCFDGAVGEEFRASVAFPFCTIEQVANQGDLGFVPPRRSGVCCDGVVRNGSSMPSTASCEFFHGWRCCRAAARSRSTITRRVRRISLPARSRCPSASSDEFSRCR